MLKPTLLIITERTLEALDNSDIIGAVIYPEEPDSVPQDDLRRAEHERASGRDPIGWAQLWSKARL